MSPARYTQLSRTAQDADRELDDAFAGDDDDDEHVPLPSTTATATATTHVPGAYDFEREYDVPPPGSPPPPSAYALPNDIGNSNGRLPAATDAAPPRAPRPSFFRRAVGAILPTHYTRLPTSDAGASTLRVGGGIENDGVFANVMAKPTRAVTAVNEDGEIYMVPEDNQKEPPPSYAHAQAEESVPPYWETTVHAPSLDLGGEILIDDLPAGSLAAFLANLAVAFFFQWIGFLLTFLLHTSHAAKFGGRAGLGLTLIQFGFYSRNGALGPLIGEDGAQAGDGTDDDPAWPALSPNALPPTATSAAQPEATAPATPAYDPALGITARDWLAFLLMTAGWFLLLSSFIGFWRIKRWEASVRAPTPATPITPEDLERDAAVRRNIESVFGISFADASAGGAAGGAGTGAGGGRMRRDENGVLVTIPTQELLEEARLARDLRAAGLL